MTCSGGVARWDSSCSRVRCHSCAPPSHAVGWDRGQSLGLHSPPDVTRDAKKCCISSFRSAAAAWAGSSRVHKRVQECSTVCPHRVASSGTARQSLRCGTSVLRMSHRLSQAVFAWQSRLWVDAVLCAAGCCCCTLLGPTATHVWRGVRAVHGGARLQGRRPACRQVSRGVGACAVAVTLPRTLFPLHAAQALLAVHSPL